MAPWQPRTGRTWYAARIVVAAALIGVGGDLFSFTLAWLTLAALPLLIAGFGLLLHTLGHCGTPGAWPDRHHKSLIAWTSSSLASFGVLGFVLLALPIGPTQFFRERMAASIGFETELGWAPPLSTTQVGMHGDRVDAARPKVLMIGDSVVQGFGVARRDVVDRPLERLLPGWQVLNGAVTGWSVDQYWLYLRRIIGFVRPRVVVVGIFTGNDFAITGREHGWGHSKPLLAVIDGHLERADRNGRCIDQMAASLLFRALWRDKPTALALIRRLCRPRELTLRELEATLQGLFAAIDATANEQGARVLYVLLPEKREYRSYGTDFQRFGSRHGDFWRLLRDGGHAVIDFGPHLARLAAGGPLPYLDDNVHFTPQGHAWLADAVASELTRRGWLAQ
jgi:lysophospholipase L1-like esterase